MTSPVDDAPQVTSLAIAPGSRLPTKYVDSVTVEAGVGIVGDRYHGTKHRHVTVQSAVDLAAASVDLGREIEPAGTRRNVTISHGQIPTRPGDRIQIGDVLLEVVRIAAPCRLLDDWIGDGARIVLRNRAGTVFRALSTGEIELGDTVTFGLPRADEE